MKILKKIMKKNRSLNNDENDIFKLVKKVYGDLNKLKNITFSDRDQAIIWAKNNKGEMIIIINLTFIAELKIAENLSEEHIIENYLKIPE